jgi:predicted  nucleic acid-binding Zn-ribbon protein
VNADVEKLLTLQEREARKLTLEAQLLQVPREVDKAKAKIAEEQATIDADRRALKEIEVRRVELDKEVQSLETQVVKYKTQQMEVKKNDEYTALGHQIETIEAQIGQCEEQEIELMLQFDEQTKSTAETEAAHKEQIRLFEKEIDRLNKQMEAVQAEIGDAVTAAEAAAGDIPAKWLEAYRNAQHRHPRAPWVVPMRDQHCGGCYLKTSGEVEGAVLTDKEPAHCDNCGRLLYRE